MCHIEALDNRDLTMTVIRLYSAAVILEGDGRLEIPGALYVTVRSVGDRGNAHSPPTRPC